MPRASQYYQHPIGQDELKSLLRYDPESGLFIWLKNQSSKVSVGAVAGSQTPERYIRISIGGRLYMAHVLAWLYMTGDYVVRGIDHKDTIRNNNKWKNLRRADQSQNNLNTKTRSDNALGAKGVYRKKSGTKWRYVAQLTADGRQMHLGYFDTIDEAKSAYSDAASKYYEEFKRTNYD